MKAIFNNLMKLSMYLDKNLLIIECELIFMAAQKKSFGQRVIAHWYQIWAELLQSCTATQERVKGQEERLRIVGWVSLFFLIIFQTLYLFELWRN